jgi:hypothetical protein
MAYELFRKHGVDLMANVGDVADYHYPTGYKAYRETVEEVFAGVSAANVMRWASCSWCSSPRRTSTRSSPSSSAA